jgi:hypothetical protein
MGRLSRALIVLGVSLAAMSVAASAAGAGDPEASASGKRVLLISNCKKARFEPKMVIIACGDAGLIAQGLTWPSWSQKTAQGVGTGVIKTCNPNCAQGGTASGPIALLLSKPQHCSNGLRLFSKLRYAWIQAPPTGPQSGSVPMGCKLASL